MNTEWQRKVPGIQLSLSERSITKREIKGYLTVEDVPAVLSASCDH